MEKSKYTYDGNLDWTPPGIEVRDYSHTDNFPSSPGAVNVGERPDPLLALPNRPVVAATPRMLDGVLDYSA
jgi:hypothetical protein